MADQYNIKSTSKTSADVADRELEATVLKGINFTGLAVPWGP